MIAARCSRCVFEYEVRRASTIGTNCLSCGYLVCFKCVVELMVCNGLNRSSIGYQCPNCSFFNCNTTTTFNGRGGREEDSSFRNPDPIAFASGVSTCLKPHKDGKLLSTNQWRVISHEDNMILQQEFIQQKYNRSMVTTVQIIDDDDDNTDSDESSSDIIITEEKK